MPKQQPLVSHEALGTLINGIATRVIQGAIPNPGIPLDQLPIRQGSNALANKIADHIDPLWAGVIILGGVMLWEQTKQQRAALNAAMATASPSSQGSESSAASSSSPQPGAGDRDIPTREGEPSPNVYTMPPYGSGGRGGRGGRS